MKAPTETTLVKACLAYLALAKVPAWRNNSGATAYQNAAGRKRLVRFGHVGSSDILGVLPLLRSDGNERRGVFLAVECKKPGGKLTPAQAQFLDAVRAAGGLALVVRSVDDLIAALDAEGL